MEFRSLSEPHRIQTLPLSASMPSFSKVNQKRRVTCRACSLPFGYVPVSALNIEYNLAFLHKLCERLEAEKSEEACGENQSNLTQMTSPQPTQMDRTVELRSRISKRLVPGGGKADLVKKPESPDTVDCRQILTLFLPDAINVRIRARCCPQTPAEEAVYQRVREACDIVYRFKFSGDILQNADTIYCAGCKCCIGVRFEPVKKDFVIPISSWRSSQFARSKMRQLSAVKPAHFEMGFPERVQENSMVGGLLIPELERENYIHSEGWVSLSLERVDVEPLFGLVGFDQFSVRYEGGEMFPTFYRSIESSPLHSQNSATWMIPARRSDRENSIVSGKVASTMSTWGRTYFDLESVDKALPYTLGHGDLVRETVRRLAPIFQAPTEEKKKEEGEEELEQ